MIIPAHERCLRFYPLAMSRHPLLASLQLDENQFTMG